MAGELSNTEGLAGLMSLMPWDSETSSPRAIAHPPTLPATLDGVCPQQPAPGQSLGRRERLEPLRSAAFHACALCEVLLMALKPGSLLWPSRTAGRGHPAWGGTRPCFPAGQGSGMNNAAGLPAEAGCLGSEEKEAAAPHSS